MTSDSYTDVSRLDGRWVYNELDERMREEFAKEFGFALAGVRRTYEVEPLAEVVRAWWERAGGGADVPEADRWRSMQDATISRRPQREQVEPVRWVDRTGPAVYASLSVEDRARFALDFEGALDVVAESWDYRPALLVIHDWWGAAFQHANPEQLAAVAETAKRIRAGDTSMFHARAGEI
ncbi:DUF6247 family protein [Streptomyces sp. NPDC049881]|uniref:DUF6247 family protein n=1 Tax=Streptomyces sp. NPDC049881 TaxID=3155778 RepID=UPI00341C671C